jgi:hypothetical protein
MLPTVALAASWLLWSGLGASAADPPAPRKKRRGEKDEDRVSMPHHSFDSPLSYEDKLGDWYVSGATLFERDRVLMHPGVTERHGWLWSTEPLLTNNFEAIFQFRVVGSQKVEETPLDQALAFWYTPQNVTASYKEETMIKTANWKAGLDEAGLNFAGFFSKFKGFGAVLSTGNSEKKHEPVVSGVQNDGTRNLEYWHHAPTKNAKSIDFRNTLNPAQFKLVVTPTSAEGHLKQSASLMWHECFKINLNVETGGYLGVTAWSGSGPGKADLVSLQRLDVYNKDSTSIGEEMKDVSREIQDAYREMLTDERRHFKDQKSQMEHLQRLVKMLSQHGETAKPAEERMFKDLEGLETRMNRLDEDCKTLTKEVSVIINKQGMETVGTMKDEIIGMRRIFIKDSATHRKKIEAVHKDVSEMKLSREKVMNPETFAQVAKQTENLEKTVQSTGTQSSWLMLLIIAAVLGIGVLMWKRMRYYEKKHFI